MHIYSLPGTDCTGASGAPEFSAGRRWYALSTLPRHEKAVEKQLNLREIECFLPTYGSVKVWKNRQRVRVVLPLFPTYLFARIDFCERSKVLQAPGVREIIGNRRRPVPVRDSEIEFLRSEFCQQRVEPFPELILGEKVRVRCGVMQGIEGTLVRKNSSLRFVLTVSLINQHAAIEVCADDLEHILEPICA